MVQFPAAGSSKPAPPIPSRSHARLPPVPHNGTLRPTIAPLVTEFGFTERNRSHSESQMATSMRLKRHGMNMPRRPEQNYLDVHDPSRMNHNRGSSDGSAMYRSVTMNAAVDLASPTTSPVDNDVYRPSFIRRLSSLPEDRRKSRTLDPDASAARVLVYSMQQLHRPMKDLLNIASDGSVRRSNLQKIFLDAYSSVDLLDRQLVAVESYSEEHDRDDNSEAILSLQRSRQACARSVVQLILALQKSVRNIVLRGSPLYVRSLMHLLYAGLIEIRNAYISLEGGIGATPKILQRDVSRGRALPAIPGRPTTSMRVREDSTLSRGAARPISNHRPSVITVGGRSASTVVPTGQPAFRPAQASDSFPGLSSFGRSARSTRSNTLVSVEEMEEEQQFERIFLQLSTACQFALQALPRCNSIFSHYRHVAAEQRGDQTELGLYDGICDRCRIATEAAEALWKRLDTVKLKDSSVRGQPDFWQLCTAFTRVSFRPTRPYNPLFPTCPHRLHDNSGAKQLTVRA